jgi:hypothetical protein
MSLHVIDSKIDLKSILGMLVDAIE